MITSGTWQRGQLAPGHQVGSKNNSAKLDEEKVKAILGSTEPNRTLAAALGVDISTVQRVRRREIWKHCI